MIFRILLMLVVIGWVWLPEFTLWHVQPANPSVEVIEQLRTIPASSVLDELGQMYLKPPSGLVKRSEIVSRAESVMSGVLSLPAYPDVEISPVFSPADLQKHPQLIIACLVAVDLLLDAHSISGREEFFQYAQESIIAFAHFESSRWLDTALFWNDHAIGARIPVLIKFWSQYRQRVDFDKEVARLVLKLVARSGALLAKPEHYAWRTGHGIIANLALLQISAAFPTLEESKQFREIAMHRFTAHLPYYINREGVTLLHSAGYNVGGVRFLAMAMRLYTLNDQPIPNEWWARYQSLEDFYALLRRPDGSLPMFGDTVGGASIFGPSRTRQRADGSAAPLEQTADWPLQKSIGIFPEAGHAVWWYPRKKNNPNPLSQTVATWSHYPGLGHKLADELSVLFWADGRNWVTSVGYWPYGFSGRSEAEAWGGGNNAPHIRGEPASSERSARLTRTGIDDEAFFVEMIRKGPNGFMVQRELLQIGADVWVVLDRQRDSIQRKTETYWTFYPDLEVIQGKTAGSFIISDPHSSQIMRSSFQTDQGRQVEQFSGSMEPFAGWVVIGQTPVPAEAIAIRANSQESWQLAVFSLRDQTSEAPSENLVATLSSAEGLDRWTIRVSGIEENTNMTIIRDQEQISIHKDEAAPTKSMLALTVVPDPQNGIAPVLAAFEASTDRSVRRVPLIPYRLRASYLLVAILVAQELLFYLMRNRLPRLNLWLRAVSVVAWLSVGFWLTEFYLVAG